MATGVVATERPRLLLHVCCGPCATAVVERLLPEYRVSLLWANPNLQPEDEYERRLEGAAQVAVAYGLVLQVPSAPPGDFERLCRGREDQPEGGERCRLCYALRLGIVCDAGRDGPYDLVATTLTISPHKPAAVINAIGAEVAAARGARYLAADFKQGGGFERSVALSRQLGIYRQRYCGCLPSRRERG